MEVAQGPNSPGYHMREEEEEEEMMIRGMRGWTDRKDKGRENDREIHEDKEKEPEKGKKGESLLPLIKCPLISVIEKRMEK